MKKYFEKMSDKRQQGKIDYKLHEIVIMTIIAVMCGFDYWEDIADYCKTKKEWFVEHIGLELETGVASHDTFQRIFQLIKPNELEKCFREWVTKVAEKTKGEVVPIDGKTSRGSGDKKRKTIHMVSAWASANKVVLGQIKTDVKSNEKTAIPTLIELLDIKGCIVTIDAMGCYKDIVKTITKGEADYVIGLKGNQGNLSKETKKLFGNEAIEQQTYTTKSKGHGREETREYGLITDIDTLPKKDDWSNLKAVGKVKSTSLQKGKLHEETRYFITSVTDVKVFANAVRSHWGIESMHWILDVTFGEDANRTRKDNSPENFSVVRHFVLNALSLHPAKISMARKRRKCQYDENFLLEVVAIIANLA